MALKLTVILLLLLFAVMQFAGRDTEVGPFAENPGAAPEEVLLSVAPLENPKPVDLTPPVAVTRVQTAEAPLTPTSAPEAATGSAQAVAEPPAVDTQSVLDLVVLDPNAALNSLSLPGANTNPPAAPAAQTTPAPSEATEVASIQLAEVTGSAVNLRAGPSTGNAVLGRARVGDVVEWVSDPAPGWALIKHPDFDDNMYMSSQFLRRLPN